VLESGAPSNRNTPGIEAAGTAARYLLLAALLAAFTLTVVKMAGQPVRSPFQPTSVDAAGEPYPLFYTGFASTGKTRLVHAPSMVELADGRIMAFWFAGSREGAPDVVIHSAVYNPGRRSWSPERIVTSRLSTQTETSRYVRKLGNPVPVRTGDGTLWLFYVSAVGGWSTSSLNAIHSVDAGKHWSAAKRLVTSPFLNLSTLVKTRPFLYQDGTVGLPIYHEMAGKFGELLRLDQHGTVLCKQRLSHGRTTLQPLILIESAKTAVGFLRYAGPLPRRVRRVISHDGGRHWSTPEPSPLPNPDSALAGVALADGSQLLVLNQDEIMRDELSLVWSGDQGRHWITLYRFEDERLLRGASLSDEAFTKHTIQLLERTDAAIANTSTFVRAVRTIMCQTHPCRFQFDYPYLIQTGNGTFHLLYTWNRSFIKHVQFNQAWLDQQQSIAQ
jgi:predicted neuraminidase